MATTLQQMPIIDVDTHFTEPPDLWTSRAPAKLRDRVPRIEPDARGNPRWRVDGHHDFGPPGFCVIRSDDTKASGHFSLRTFEEMTPAATEPKARLAVMDREGIAAQIVYPNVLGFAGAEIMQIRDDELRNFCITAYNDGIAELQASSGGRILPQAMLPFWDADLSLRELIRCHEELGLTGFTMSDSPQKWGTPCLHEPYWDSLWGEAAERGLPCNFHIGSGGYGGGHWEGLEGGRKVAIMSVTLYIENARCISNLIFSGLLDKHPGVKFVSVESGIGWLPFLLEACEYQCHENFEPGRGLALTPREYFQRQIYSSFWFERESVARSIEILGEDNVMFETDFPHPTCLYPNPRESMEASIGQLDEAVQRKLLYETASRVYQIDVSKLVQAP